MSASRHSPTRRATRERAWHLRASLVSAAFAVAAFAPLVFGDSRLADLAGGLYLALAATGLAFAVGVGGLPSLAQGAFVAAGAVVSARLLQVGAPTVVAAPVGRGRRRRLARLWSPLLFVRLPRAGIAAATWIVAWLVAPRSVARLVLRRDGRDLSSPPVRHRRGTTSSRSR